MILLIIKTIYIEEKILKKMIYFLQQIKKKLNYFYNKIFELINLKFKNYIISSFQKNKFNKGNVFLVLFTLKLILYI